MTTSTEPNHVALPSTSSTGPVAGPDLLTLKEVAAVLRCSVRTVRRRVHEGDLPYIRRNGGSHILVSRTDLNAYIAGCRS